MAGIDRIGIEVELIAPVGGSRRNLADHLAAACGGTVTQNWHLDSEPSANKSVGVFHHMTPAFDVVDGAGRPVARLVDDITIRRDLDFDAAPHPGWSRVVSDDPRFLRMLSGFLAPCGPDLAAVDDIVAGLGLVAEHKESAIRLVDDSGASVALLAHMPGERQRVTELISPVITGDRQPWIDLVMGAVAELGFVVPHEGATHLHYDAAPFRSAQPFRRLVTTFGEHAAGMRELFGTNPNCVRIGRLPEAIDQIVNATDFDEMPWSEIADRIAPVEGLAKYLDVNIINLIRSEPPIDTVEIRTLPSTASASDLAAMVNQVDAVMAGLLKPAAHACA